MEFNKAYSRDEFLSFLRVNFLPEDFKQEISDVENPIQFQYTQKVTRLGECESLGLVVYEVRHSSKHDARVGLTKEAFRLLADEFCERALVFFVPKDDNNNYRFSLIEITLDQLEESSRVSRRYSNPHRYSYYLGKGIAYYTPNKYLNEYGRVVSVEDLRNRFSVDVLTKAFYQELSDWYAWAIMVVRFPNDLKTLEDNQKYNSEAMIRLITRLIFVWFLKQRHLVPDEFFDEQFIANELIQGFTPHAETTLFGKAYDSKYYKGVLQNLFFAMLNSPITPEGKDTISERRFRNGRGDYDNNKLMRHEELFINPAKFVELANKYVPFLNGGLFDCLDDKDRGIYIDAFTDRKVISDQLVIPDFLFFGDEVGKNIDLSEWYGDKKKKKVSARGIIDILKRYNFTVEENTPFDQEVSLDPELLGKVFENLLAAYNPETKDLVRKNTGSFYTPREIVQYMVDESLIAHLKRTVGEDLEPEYRELVQYTDEEPNLTDDQKRQIMQSLYECKVLDPACGSGAFPMGMLQQMVHILNRIDPNNEQWKEMMLNNAISETSDAYRTATDEERAEIVADIERSFNESINRPDYARKLYLIENCIYGVDIQPIAIQISKLRFFISLVVDQKTNNNPVDNFGIRPLPNLEAKFVAANTLLTVEKRDSSLFTSETVLKKELEMKDAKHRIFGAKTVKTKRKYKERVNELREELAKMLEDIGAVGNEEAQQLALWDMFDQNIHADFFDSEWMFGITDGFDIVIGNPPYNELRDLAEKEQAIYRSSPYYEYATGGRVNMFQFFYPFGIFSVKDNGICCFITQNSLLAEESAYENRKFIFDCCQILSVSSFPERDNKNLRVFESAKMSVCICLIKKSEMCNSVPFVVNVWKDKYMSSGHALRISKEEIATVYPNELIIPICDIDSWVLLLKLKSKGDICIVSQAGEIDMTKYKSLFVDNRDYSRVITGAQVLRYRITDTPSQGKVLFLNKMAVKLSDDRKKCFASQRIVTQRITGVDSKIRLIATLIPPYTFCANSTNYISPVNNRLNLYYLLGVFNSKCMNFIFKQTSTNTNVTGKEIAKFPIINASQSIVNEIEDNVLHILNDKQKDWDANTCILEKNIDFIVYRLYDLTYDEVLLVDPETPITREEYEKKIAVK